MLVLQIEQPVLKRSIKSTSGKIMGNAVELALGSRKIAFGAVLAVSLVGLAALLTQVFSVLQGINPIAAAAAVMVSVVGTIWLVRTARS